MMFFARAVVTGFALALGSAVFKKIAPKIGLGEEDKNKDKNQSEMAAGEAATDPNLA
jgi:hypothetical protein